MSYYKAEVYKEGIYFHHFGTVVQIVTELRVTTKIDESMEMK